MTIRVPVGRPGAIEQYHCRPERTSRTFFWSGSENHTAPRVDYWRCRDCSHTRLQMHDVGDADGLVRTTISRMVKTTSTVEYGDERSLDRDDLVSEGMELIWQLYTKWSPTLNPSFASYATYYLPLRLVRWWRRRFGTGGNKPLGSAVSLDAERHSAGLDSDSDWRSEGGFSADRSSGGFAGASSSSALGAWSGDGDEGGGLILRELFVRSDRRALRLGAGDGVRPDEDASGRA